jgi:uncharacterized protein involved in exopolysaccharide biosynthesis
MATQPVENFHPIRSARSESADVPIAEYLGILWVRRNLLIAAAIGAGLLALLYTSLVTPTYEAEVMVLVSQAKIGERQTESPLNVSTFRSIIVNHSLAAQVIKEFKLTRPPMFHVFGASTDPLTPSRFLDSYLSVEQIGDTNLIRIRVRGPDPNVVAKVANRLVENAVVLNRELSQREVVAVRDYIKTQVDETSKRLEDLKTQVLDFKEKAQVDLLKKDAEAALEERSELIGLLVDIESARARLTRGEEQLAGRKPTLTVTRSIDKDAALSEAVRAGGGASGTGNPNGTNTGIGVLGLQLRDEQVDQVYSEIAKDLAKTRTELAGLESQRRALVDKYGLGGDKLKSLNSLYAKETQLARLQMDYDLVSRIYSDLATRYEQARIQVASRSTQLEVVDSALVPEVRIAPRRASTVALTTFFGLLAASTVVFLTHYLRIHARHHLR